MLADSCLPPTPYLRRRSQHQRERKQNFIGPGLGGPRLRQGAYRVDSIASTLVPLTPASCNGDGSDWHEMSGDVLSFAKTSSDCSEAPRSVNPSTGPSPEPGR